MDKWVVNVRAICNLKNARCVYQLLLIYCFKSAWLRTYLLLTNIFWVIEEKSVRSVVERRLKQFHNVRSWFSYRTRNFLASLNVSFKGRNVLIPVFNFVQQCAFSTSLLLTCTQRILCLSFYLKSTVELLLKTCWILDTRIFFTHYVFFFLLVIIFAFVLFNFLLNRFQIS